MYKKVNMSNITSKLNYLYKDECEKNISAIIIYNKDGKFFFDPEYKNVMTDLEVEALLLRGALVDREGKYYRPSSFNDNNVSFSDALINPEDMEFIDVTKFGISPSSENDCTKKVNELLSKGYIKLYFPAGTYFLNMSITMPDVKIKGDGIERTIFKPYSDKDVFDIFMDDENLFRVEIHDVSIKNDTFTNNDGIKIHSGGKKLTHNDQHIFSNLCISGFRYNINILDRCIYTIFRNITCENALKDNLNIYATDCINHLEFNNCKFWNAGENGVSIVGENANVCVMVINFISCTLEGNNKNNIEEKGGLFVKNVANISFDTPYIELNKLNCIVARGIVNGFTVKNGLLWDSEYCYDINCEQFYGEISTSRLAGKRKYKALTGVSKIVEIGNDTNNPIEEEVGNYSRTSYTSISPLVLPTKWFHEDEVDVSDCNILINSATHDLFNLLKGTKGQIVYIINAGNTCTVKQTGNILLKDDDDLSIDGWNVLSLTLVYNGTKWVELSRSTRI